MFVKAGPNGRCRLLDDAADFFTRIRVMYGNGGEGHGAAHCISIKLAVIGFPEVLEAAGVDAPTGAA